MNDRNSATDDSSSKSSPDPSRALIERLQAGYQRVQGNPRAKLQFCEAAIAELEAFPGMELNAAELQLECANILAETVRSGQVELLERGIAHAKRAVSTYKRFNDDVNWCNASITLGFLYKNIQRGALPLYRDKAIAYYRRVMPIVEAGGPPSRTARFKNNLGNAWRERLRGDRSFNFAKARETYESALKSISVEQDPVAWTMATNNIAQLSALDGSPDDLVFAISLFKQVLTIRERMNDAYSLADTQTDLALAYIRLLKGNRRDTIEEAIRLLNAAQTIRADRQTRGDLAKTYRALGSAYVSRPTGDRTSNLDTSEQYLRRSLELATVEDNPLGWAETNLNLANVLLARKDRLSKGRAREALDHARKAETIYSENLDRYMADCLGTIALAYSSMADYLMAIDAYRSALRHCPDDTQKAATLHINLSHAYLRQATAAPAERKIWLSLGMASAQSARDLLSRIEHAELWIEATRSLGELHLNAVPADTSKGIELLRESLTACDPDIFASEYRIIQLEIARAHFQTGDWAPARNAFDEVDRITAGIFEITDTEAGLRSVINEIGLSSAEAAFCEWKLGRPDAALIRLEKGRGRLLQKSLIMHERTLQVAPSEIQADLARYGALIAQLEFQYRQAADDGNLDSKVELANQLRVSRAELKGLLERVETRDNADGNDDLDLASLLTPIPPNSAVVLISLTSMGGLIICVRNADSRLNSDQIGELSRDEALILNGAVVAALREHYAKRASLRLDDKDEQRERIAAVQSDIEDIGPVLSGKLTSILAKFNGLRRIYFMLPGGLNCFPLHALPIEIEGVTAELFQHFTVGYIPSINLLARSCSKKASLETNSPSLVAVVGADLTFAQLEVDIIETFFLSAALFPDSDGEGHIDPDNLRRAILNSTHAHFACHGVYDIARPLRSSLLFRGEERLSLSEIYALRFEKTEYIMLSACETGLTDVTEAVDEFMGMPSGFLMAGAPNVLSTLWQVNDLSSFLIATRTYKNLVTGKMDLCSALQETQTWLRDVTNYELSQVLDGLHARLPPLKAASRSLVMALAEKYGSHPKPHDRPFASPFFWAPYVVTGA